MEQKFGPARSIPASPLTSPRSAIASPMRRSWDGDVVFLAKLPDSHAQNKADGNESSKELHNSAGFVQTANMAAAPVSKKSPQKRFLSSLNSRTTGSGKALSSSSSTTNQVRDANSTASSSSSSRIIELVARGNTAKAATESFSNMAMPSSSRRGSGEGKAPAKAPLSSLLGKLQIKTSENNRLLVIVNVMGSAGPLRFLVGSDDTVQRVVELALRAYARERRRPALGLHTKQFDLHDANNDFEALNPSTQIGIIGTRQFLLCRKKQEVTNVVLQKNSQTSVHQPLKSWWNMMSSIVCSH